MKKIICCFSSILSAFMLILSIISFSASAAQSPEFEATLGFSYVPGYTLDNYLSEFPDCKSYFYTVFIDKNSNYDDMKYVNVRFYKLSDFLEYTNDNGVITFTSSSINRFDFLWWYSDLRFSHSGRNYSSGSSSDFIIDTNNMLFNDIPVLELQLVIDSQPLIDDGSLYIEVESFPKLEGKSTLNMYKLDENGYIKSDIETDRYLSIQLIDIDIRNNSNKDFQFALYFVPKGESLTYLTEARQFLGSRFFSNNPLFIYLTEEWFYNYDVLTHQNRIVNAVSCYHIAKSGTTYTCHVGENQINLKQDVEYDLVVLGSFIEAHPNGYLDSHFNDTLMELYNISYIDPYITLDGSGYMPEEVYRSTFILDKSTDYKSTQYSDDGFLQIGALGTSYAYDPNDTNNEVFNTIYAQQNSEGVPNYKNSSFSELYNTHHFDYGGSSGVNIGSNLNLSSGFGGLFGMLSSFLKQLPGDFFNIFSFGFTALIIIGIIKAVKS